MTPRGGLVAVLVGSVLVAACAAAPASVAPSAGPSAAVPSTATSGSPVPGHGERLAASFLELVQDPAARYRMDQTLTVVVGEATTKAVSHSDIAGIDMLVVSDRTASGTTTHIEYLQTDGSAYERTGDEDWRAVGPAEPQPGLYPFMKGSDLRYAGREIQGGSLTDSLSLDQSIPIGTSVAESFGVMGGTATIVSFDCFLEADGIPVHVEIGFRLDDSEGTAAGYGTIVQDYAEFGGDIVIAPPVT